MNNLPIIRNREEIQKNASKAAPSNKQKRQHVAIVARVPDIIFSVFFFQFVCLCQNTCPPTFFTISTTWLPIALKTLHRKHPEVSNFLHFSKMPLQSTCFQIQFYLCAVLSSSQSRTPLSISRHFAIGRKFLLKASFYTLFPVLQPFYSILYTTIAESKCILSHFSILLSFFIQRKKSIFEFKLTCN